MFEIFLFINPIGFYCYDVERRILELTKQLNIDINYHFIPCANFGIVYDDINRRRRNCQKMCDISFYTFTISQALKYYHAIKLAYGNKKARIFLRVLQEKLSSGIVSSSLTLLETTMQEAGLNINKIKALSGSKYVTDSINQDQKLINHWHIKETPTTIIFNENDPASSGVLFEGIISHDDLIDIFVPNNKSDFADSSNTLSKMFSSNHLRLI